MRCLFPGARTAQEHRDGNGDEVGQDQPGHPLRLLRSTGATVTSVLSSEKRFSG